MSEPASAVIFGSSLGQRLRQIVKKNTQEETHRRIRVTDDIINKALAEKISELETAAANGQTTMKIYTSTDTKTCKDIENVLRRFQGKHDLHFTLNSDYDDKGYQRNFSGQYKLIKCDLYADWPSQQ